MQVVEKIRWASLPRDRDILVNTHCAKCGASGSGINFVVSDHSLGLFCNECLETIKLTLPSAYFIRTEEINRKLLSDILNKRKVTKFIHGKNLYLSFSIIIRNYRDKVEFCNY